ncbi:hypothetical protein FHU10_1404 [Serratia fonticola]|uniref:Uncharacterized protein n=1 Tax=Serratia fonticola TaxID=47917 RepID=A0A542BJ10_SERFO|nr:hypothetical protein FHU09_1046 [Serratia fonticola]TQI99416.1 hypothetical protein FHU11_5006 [Serratia fonticola]TVZ68941.1 hypothetical protein FHU10_1404 [Serratia fonticola]
MQREIIDKLVSEVLLRMRPRALVLLTAAEGYHEIIRTRLQHCQTFSPVILFSDNARQFHAETDWRQLGPITSLAEISQSGALDNIERVLIPFLDFATAAEVANGLLQSDAARFIQLARMSGRPIMALDYNCNPASELNQLKGLSRAPQADYLPKLAAQGIELCTLDRMLSAQPAATEQLAAPPQAYVTLSELKRLNGHSPPGAKLTDLALEYSRGKK